MMQKEEHIVRYTADELEEMIHRGEDQTDYAYLDAMTEEELEASIDHEEEGEFDWSTAQAGIPGPKRPLTVHIDQDIIAWFTAQGEHYETDMNTVLRRHVEAQKQQERQQAAPALARR